MSVFTASETGTATPAIRCLLDHLVTIGVFDLDLESCHYRPTNLGAQLSEDAPEGIKRSWPGAVGPPHRTAPWL
jgi:hypothetical protein